LIATSRIQMLAGGGGEQDEQVEEEREAMKKFIGLKR
jgi:hypothetical protein